MIVMGLPKAIRRVANMLRPLVLNHLVLFLATAEKKRRPVRARVSIAFFGEINPRTHLTKL